MATGYGLNGPGIESRCRRDFPHLSRPALGPPSLLYNGYRVFPGGKERPGRDADPSPPSIAVGDERVELYLYSPYGPYGLYRASVPVQGCTLPFFFHNTTHLLLKGAPFFIFLTQFIYTFCMYLATNSEFRHMQHSMITFITEIASVYCAVRTAALKGTVYVSS